MVAPSYFRAGTRLKPRLLRGGGLEVIAGSEDYSWFDVETGHQCNFRLGADGVERCFPAAVQNSDYYYLDAACTKPALVGSNLTCDGGDPRPFQYVTLGTSGGADWGCGGTAYRLGTPVLASTQVYYNGADVCVPTSVTGTVWPLEKVPLETFVAVQRVSRPRLPNMNAWVREGTDGSSEVVGFYDPVRQTPCSGLGLGVSSDACVPSWVELKDTFADSGCTQRVGFADYPYTCRPPTSTAFLELETQADSCKTTKSIHGLWQIAGTRRTQVFDYFDGSCELSSSELRTAYLPGPPIEVASLPKLDVIQVGDGSLKTLFYGFDNVPFFPVAPGFGFIETASGDSCDRRLFADGTWRCVPSAFARMRDVDVYYQTADCTGERLYAWRPNEECVQPPEPIGITVEPFWPIEGKCPVRPVTDTLEFDGPPATRSTLFGSSPVVSCRALSAPDDQVKILRATKVVNPAERFIPFELKLSD